MNCTVPSTGQVMARQVVEKIWNEGEKSRVCVGPLFFNVMCGATEATDNELNWMYGPSYRSLGVHCRCQLTMNIIKGDSVMMREQGGPAAGGGRSPLCRAKMR
jgi:hypothetical protein